jgi:hypothetical protein
VRTVVGPAPRAKEVSAETAVARDIAGVRRAYRNDAGIRPASIKSRVAFEKLPVSNWSVRGTPSTSIATRLPPMPRILMLSVPKRVPAAS